MVSGYDIKIPDINQNTNCKGHLNFWPGRWREKYSTFLPPDAPNRCAVATACDMHEVTKLSEDAVGRNMGNQKLGIDKKCSRNREGAEFSAQLLFPKKAGNEHVTLHKMFISIDLSSWGYSDE